MKAFRTRLLYGFTPTTNVETAITFDDEQFDTDSGLSGSTFTVPAAWDGLYGEIFGGFELTASVDSRCSIMKSTDGGTVYFEVASIGYRDAASGAIYSLNSGPLLFTTGDKYQIRVLVEAASSVDDTISTFFSGIAYESTTEHAFFRATAHSGSVSVAASSITTPNYNGPYFGDPSLFVRNQFVVPASLNGAYGIFSHYVTTRNAFGRNIYVERSENGGLDYVRICGSQTTAADNTFCISGPHLLTTGHIYRHRIWNFNASNAQNIFGIQGASSYYDPSFFSCHIVKDP